MQSNRRLWRIRLGQHGVVAEECFSDGSAGLGFDIHEDLTGKFPEKWREFNAIYIPVWLEANPGKSRIAAGLSCGALWSFGYGIKVDDVLMAPAPDGRFHFGTLSGEYYYEPENRFPHRRRVDWSGPVVDRDSLSDGLLRSIRGPLSLVETTKHADEIDALLAGTQPPVISVADPDVEDPAVFALEQHLEDFLVTNWDQTSLADDYELVQEEGEVIAQQFPTDTGPIDILAVSKDNSELLVIELKRGRASDVVVGQVQRYMGYVVSELATEDQQVRGVIIALEDDQRLRRALTVAPNVSFYRYRVRFDLEKGDIDP